MFWLSPDWQDELLTIRWQASLTSPFVGRRADGRSPQQGRRPGRCSLCRARPATSASTLRYNCIQPAVGNVLNDWKEPGARSGWVPGLSCVILWARHGHPLPVSFCSLDNGNQHHPTHLQARFRGGSAVQALMALSGQAWPSSHL